MNVFDLSAKLTLDTSEYENKLSSAAQGASSIGSRIGGGIKKAAKIGAAAITAATGAVSAFAGSAVKVGMGFDSAMSQVAATMGTTVEEIQQLRDFAQEMGATTAFSATQAADALNYMALAGYDAETSMSMLPNVLNLAAAGGIELAQASDMITDAQSALGLTLDDTSALVDKMAAAASRSNTSVGQLGEAILTIGGTAKALAGGTTELSAALGVLADNGIKGAEGGTALRNVLLGIQGDKFQETFGSLGVSAYDAGGNLRELSDILDDMNAAMEGMTDQQKTDLINQTFNRQDLKSVNALLATTADRWTELQGAIEDSTGAAQAMADTQLDNLAGDVTLFKSALEGVKIAISDGLSPALRNFVKFGSDGLSKLTTAFQEGGFSGAMDAFGTVLSDGLTMIIEMLPQMVNAGMSLLSSLAQGILDNLPAMVEAALQVILTLAQGIAESLPELIPTLHMVIVQIVETLIDNVDMLIDSALAIIIALAEGLITSLPNLLAKAPEIVAKLVNAVIENAPKLLESALQMVVTLAKGIIQNLPQIAKTAGQIIMTLVKGIGNLAGKIASIGMDIVRGIWQGISNGYEWITGKISGWISNVLGFFKNLLGIASPSKVFAQIGGFMVEGLGVGWDKQFGKVKDQIEDDLDFNPAPLDIAINEDLTNTFSRLKENVFSLGREFAQSIEGISFKPAFADMTALKQPARLGPELATSHKEPNPIVINVYGAKGQDPAEIAREVERRIARNILSREAVWA